MTAKGPATSTVFLHGLGGSKEDWNEVLSQLPKALQATAIDLLGAGEAPKPLDGYDPASLARWVSAALFRGGRSRVKLVGHSLGARVAGELASQQPERVEALALVSPLGAVSYGLTDKLKWKAMSRRAIIESVPESSIRGASGYGFAVDGAGKRGFVERALKARTGREATAVARAVEKSVDGVLDAPPLSERLRTTRMPLLVVAGALDPLAPPADSRGLLKARPDARFEQLAGLGHYPMLEDPARVAALLKDFLR